MPGRDVLNNDQTGPVQLPMFMRANDIVDSLTGTLDKSEYPVEKVMEHKLYVSKGRFGHGHGTGVHESVSERGVINPVQLVHGLNHSLMMGQGHHRVAAAADIERATHQDKWVPVVHTDAPVDQFSDVVEKRAAISDYRRWSRNTPAHDQDVDWDLG